MSARFDHRAWGKAVCQRTDLQPSDKQVALVLALHANEHCKARPGRTLLAKMTGLHPSTITTSIAALEARGIIEVTRVLGRGSSYMLQPVASDDQSPQTTRPVASDDQTSRLRRPDQSPQTTRLVASGDTEVPREVPREVLSTSNRCAVDGAGARRQGKRQVARSLFDHWRERCGHPNAKATAERLRKIEARLDEGYSVEDIRKAIGGAARAAYVNDAGKRFDDIELICRSG